MKAFIRLIAGPAMTTAALAGPFSPAAGVPGSDAVASNNPLFSVWASSAQISRGRTDIFYPEDESFTTYGSAANATGPADGTINPDVAPVVSLGDGGSAVLTFNTPFADVPGPDFAVFENGFLSFGGIYFLELAHVEVSSDGMNFYRFPSDSLTPPSSTPGEGSAVNPTNVRNLAGKYIAGWGTPFDLAELGSRYPALDIQRITKVRIIDVVGTNRPESASRDASGRIIADPYPTDYPTGGFDLDAVGAFKATTTTYATWTASQNRANADAAPTADPDKNGVANLIEYLTGSGTVTMATDITGRTLRFTRLSYRTGGNLKLQASTDLIHWVTLATSTNAATMVSSNPAAATVSESGSFRKETSVKVPLASDYRYFRLAAELVP